MGRKLNMIKPKISILPIPIKRPTYDSLKKQVKRRDMKIESLENGVRTLKYLCNRQGTLIKELNRKADDLDRDAKAISKVTHWYGTRKQLKWWQKFI
jgi:predicted RNase H-like nuclease (RuvC/YqgF family)